MANRYYVFDGLTTMFGIDSFGNLSLGRLEHAVHSGGYASRKEAESVAAHFNALYRAGYSGRKSFNVIAENEAMATEQDGDWTITACRFPATIRSFDVEFNFIETTDGWTQPKVGVIDGQKFVLKHGRNTSREHVINEYKACEFLRTCGLNVPAARLYDMDGETVLLLQYIDNTRSLEWEIAKTGFVEGAIRDELVRTYGVIALMAGFDTYNNGNVLWDGIRLWFVDNGSSFQWRATGGLKKPWQYAERSDPLSAKNGIMSLWEYQRTNVLRKCLPRLSMEDVLRGVEVFNIGGAVAALDSTCKTEAMEEFTRSLFELAKKGRVS